jgi:hypothetical protein
VRARGGDGFVERGRRNDNPGFRRKGYALRQQQRQRAEPERKRDGRAARAGRFADDAFLDVHDVRPDSINWYRAQRA